MRLPRVRFTVRRLMIAVATSGVILAVYPLMGFSEAQAVLVGSGLALGVLFEHGNGGWLNLIGMATGMTALGASSWFYCLSAATPAAEFAFIVVCYGIFGACFGAVTGFLPWSLVQKFDPEPVSD
jgi:hypothetical protein